MNILYTVTTGIGCECETTIYNNIEGVITHIDGLDGYQQILKCAWNDRAEYTGKTSKRFDLDGDEVLKMSEYVETFDGVQTLSGQTIHDDDVVHLSIKTHILSNGEYYAL
jgi:hypothetical protein